MQNLRRSMLTAAAICASSIALGTHAMAQCTDWVAGPLNEGAAPNGAEATVYASTTWDPDGAGPQPEMLVVGGDFFTVEGVFCGCIAARNSLTGQWQDLAGGFRQSF